MLNPAERVLPECCRGVAAHADGAIADCSNETSPLLGHETRGSASCLGNAVESSKSGRDVGSSVGPQPWTCETRALTSNTAPLVITFLFQHMLDVVSMIAAGKLGTVELGAVSFASVNASITGYTVLAGLATSLDTFCAQAYGSGRKDLVGLYCQRTALFLACFAIPISCLWFFSENILVHLVPEREIARLASVYLRVSIGALPGYIMFQCAERFLEVQGEFKAITFSAFIVLAVHVALLPFLADQLGFIGVPIAVVAARTLQPVLLVLYVRFVKGLDCWEGFTRRALRNWGMMLELAVPDMIMTEAEFLAFEIMTIFASRFGTEYLAAQSVLTTVTMVCFNVPFSMSITVSLRVSQLIGAGYVKAAKMTANLGFVAALAVGSVIFIISLAARNFITGIFSQDPEVRRLAAETLPILGVVALVDSLCIMAHGVLRGIGRQRIGGPVNLIAHYGISIPLAAWLAFGRNMRLKGSYTGLLTGLAWALLVEFVYIRRVNWNNTAQEALARTIAG